jgi:hypothetical protein
MERRRQSTSVMKHLATALDLADAALMRIEMSGYLLAGDQEPSEGTGLPKPAGEVLYFAELLLPRLETLVRVLSKRPAVAAAADHARRFYEEDDDEA